MHRHPRPHRALRAKPAHPALPTASAPQHQRLHPQRHSALPTGPRPRKRAFLPGSKTCSALAALPRPSLHRPPHPQSRRPVSRAGMAVVPAKAGAAATNAPTAMATPAAMQAEMPRAMPATPMKAGAVAATNAPSALRKAHAPSKPAQRATPSAAMTARKANAAKAVKTAKEAAAAATPRPARWTMPAHWTARPCPRQAPEQTAQPKSSAPNVRHAVSAVKAQAAPPAASAAHAAKAVSAHHAHRSPPPTKLQWPTLSTQHPSQPCLTWT